MTPNPWQEAKSYNRITYRTISLQGKLYQASEKVQMRTYAGIALVWCLIV